MARSPAPNLPAGNPLSYEFEVVGSPPADLKDAYHALLRMEWWAALLIIVAGYLLLNALFAGLYLVTGGVGNMRPGSFPDAFFFSVETMGTIGYGAMYPVSTLANVLMVVESVVGLLFTALATGLVFVRFSRIRGRVVFSKQVAIGPFDGVPTLMIRIGNARTNRIFDAHFRVTLTLTGRTKEGVMIYRTHALPLIREHAPTLMQSWQIMHRVDENSPLFGQTPESLKAQDAEINVALSGTDDASLQTVHGRYAWESPDIIFGARLADVLSERGNKVILNLREFHSLAPTEPTADFPFPKKAP